MIKFLFPIILILFLLLPNVSLALELDYPEIMGITPHLDMDLNLLIAWFYYFIVSIAGLAAFVMIVWGGFLWLSSAGNPSRIGEAKDRIFSAFLGLIIILGSWLILHTINPELIALRLPGLEDIPAAEPPSEDPIEDPPIPLPQGQTVIFVTTKAEKGMLFGGKVGLNNFCKANRPDNLPLSCMNITAFISVDGNDEIRGMHSNQNGVDGLFRSNDQIHWWHPTDGAKHRIANNWHGMLDGDIENPQVTGTGTSLQFVWTGSNSDGSIHKIGDIEVTCNGWKEGGMYGATGHWNVPNSLWLHHSSAAICGVERYLRCICLIPD